VRRLLLGLGLAGVVWTAAFRGPRRQFWPRMTVGVGSLGLFALATDRRLRQERPRWRDLAHRDLEAATEDMLTHLLRSLLKQDNTLWLPSVLVRNELVARREQRATKDAGAK